MDDARDETAGTATRWELLRDLAVFQLKLTVDALRDLVLSPVSLVAALLDLLGGGERPGRRFYDVLHTGRRSEAWINLFGEAGREPRSPAAQTDRATLDAVVQRVEQIVSRQVERGGITAAAKQAIDRSLDAISRAGPRDGGT